MKVLFVATVRSHIGQFHMPFIRELKKLGCTVDAAYRDNSADKPNLDMSGIDRVFEVPFSRSPYSADNIKAYMVLKKILNENDYDAVHCHTPMGAVVTRLAAKSLRKKGLKVIYTAHGFHFYKGAPKFNWLTFYNVEKTLAKHTDCLITINREDYDLAISKKFAAGRIELVHGVGVDISKFKPLNDDEKHRLRSEYGYSDDEFILIYPADLAERKNHDMLFKAMQALNNKSVRLLCPGQPQLLDEFKQKTRELGIENRVEFLGYRRDIEKLDALADVSVSTSRQEGLPVNLIEAMACGNAIVATDVRGNNDLVENGKNGFLVPLNDYVAMAEKINYLYENRALLEELKKNNLEKVKQYTTDSVNKEMLSIYKSLKLI